MADKISPERRSANMARIRSKDTTPELAVRRLAHRLGYRFRLHARHLPGQPDLVFARRRKVIFVHGCFWHRHEGCQDCSDPKTRRDYWVPKFERTIDRDRRSVNLLKDAGWQSLVIWECETVDLPALARRLTAFLDDDPV
jgi:DNA mismatch endonuclease (patch repair protein)